MMDADPTEQLDRWPQVDRGGIEEIKEWLTTQPHLPAIKEHEMAMFLHANYNNQEATRKTIENYYTMRTSYTELFTDRDIFSDPLQTALKIVMFTTLPGETKEGYKMAYSRLLTSDATHMNHLQVLKVLTMCMDLWIKLEGNAKGHVMLSDMEGMHLGHMRKINMDAAKKQMAYAQEALPVRLKQIHYLNVVPFMNRLMMLVRPLLRKEVQEMIQMHVNVSTVYNTIPIESLPNEYGGKAGTFEELEKSFKETLYAHSDWFREMERKNLVDESKRPPKPRRYMFGLFG
ncbi:alpha-tocopherol transfer protein-like [Anopheles bellator]|uniref:alpha-tocopherol transfer protein-like n=1 Tax=Anopheles bellator TaxID=139047 RepID=UPI002648AC11|nr:alpha-tocopherol transfer protein-like [Anopheles bellator]